MRVVCAHLHGDRSDKRDRDFMQPSAGLQIASQIDRDRYDVTLYHEMWHGSHTADVPTVDIVFLTGLQKDFDRQRQLAYFFKCKGAITVAGGSVCTLFPDFATQFFDVVCAGGVDSVSDVMRDFERGELRPIYVSSQQRVTDYRIDYGMLAASGIRGRVHLIEASRGCNFKCDFCVIPAEGARHTQFGVPNVIQMVDDAIDASPRASLKRCYPTAWFIDNNFANNHAYARDLCAALRAHPRLKAWGALVTQDILRNRALVAEMAHSKCVALFTGIESIRPDFLVTHQKRQNVKHAATLFDDVAYARAQGITVIYGYLFDPRLSAIDDMIDQVRTLMNVEPLTFPSFFSFVSPLLGTPLFWDSVERGELRPNLRLRDLEGQSIAYRDCIDSDRDLSAFAYRLFKQTHTLIGSPALALKSIRASRRIGATRPLQHVLTAGTNLRAMRIRRKRSVQVERNYLGGTDVLDPQYFSYPPGISNEDRERYFAPIMVTDESGQAAAWLRRYHRQRVDGAAAGA